MLMLPMKCAPTVVGQPRGDTETASQTPPLRVFRVKLSRRAFIYPFSRHFLRIKQHSPPTQTVEKSPQPSKERRQAFPPGTGCRTFSNGLSAAEAGTRMRGICGTFQTLYCLFKFLPMFLCLVSPRKKKHRISFHFV